MFSITQNGNFQPRLRYAQYENLEDALRHLQRTKYPCILYDDDKKIWVEKWRVRKVTGTEWIYMVTLYDAPGGLKMMNEEEFETCIVCNSVGVAMGIED